MAGIANLSRVPKNSGIYQTMEVSILMCFMIVLCSTRSSTRKPNNSDSEACKPISSVNFNATIAPDFPNCCIPGLAYRTFTCSPNLQGTNNAVLYVTSFNLSNPRSLRPCTYSEWNMEPMAALATGWYSQDRSLCLKNIQVLAPNRRTVVARMVAECYSPNGCLSDHSFTEPCAPNAVAANEQVWRKLGVVLSVVIFVATRKWRRSRRRRMEKQALIEGMRLDEILPHQFSYHDLKMATRNFDPELTLGAGGFGSVFKGELADGSLVAVKKMDVKIQGSSKGHSQFKAEGPAALLVYEFMPNGSLDKWIFTKNDDDKGGGSANLLLNWNQRHSIAIDVARGLTYLHEGCRKQVLHLDIKPQNILLDENLRARISDFGLSKLAEWGKSQVVTVMRGTPGYMAPEWLHTKVTFTALESGNVIELIDNKLLDNDLASTSSGLELKDAKRYVKIGLWCIQLEAAIRPSMRNVLDMLEGNIDVLDATTFK
ncbi:G-type lectin S-receptor-like serine/threonine-protein kinase SD2-5 [Selaginella moellendorffii]|uniref:G-type lectin S-receptor-like serine/threonine-protein kinase SD2-5 n=1 Tax=Selaginella moellendorffii TaxID=88036 RepID=UPI000D1C491B|nr:G-type lectin S-receptor-like serine/threonine-protein kinase SD2-5 [Selaginella moellendorffii]|eukprot:XP_024545223.1 G-type lectin S-receptor-like serine/threonine-protein kinase SD2-5 [Selaginella moellendorffii]